MATGSAVGTAATANATAAVRTVSNDWPLARSKAIDTASAAPAIGRTRLSSVVSGRRDRVRSRRETSPTSVSMPVAVTTSSAVPPVTLVPM
jgi:hypothetical protein